MSETLQLHTIYPAQHNLAALPEVGEGVVREMAAAFGHDLITGSSVVENYGRLIGTVGAHQELQRNIGAVQEMLGTDQDAVDLARSWVNRSGLLVPLPERSFIAEVHAPEVYDAAVVTGAVRNWMEWRKQALLDRSPDQLGSVWLVAGVREMKVSEGPEVTPGMTEAAYMERHVLPELLDHGFDAQLRVVHSTKGSEVMSKAADLLAPDDSVLYVGSAGQAYLGASELRTAMRRSHQEFDKDGDQLFMTSNTYVELGTGAEPTATHQNPFSALGMVVRDLRAYAQHMR